MNDMYSDSPTPESVSTVASPTSDSATLGRYGVSPESVMQPKRPLSAYNILFQLERKRLIKGFSVDTPYTRGEVFSLELNRDTRTEKPKRPHRKAHGMISFNNLAKAIAQKWRDMEDSQRALFEERAEDEKRKYAVEIEAWLLSQEKTPHIKKRLAALRRGSLKKYLTQKSIKSIETSSGQRSPPIECIVAPKTSRERPRPLREEQEPRNPTAGYEQDPQAQKRNRFPLDNSLGLLPSPQIQLQLYQYQSQVQQHRQNFEVQAPIFARPLVDTVDPYQETYNQTLLFGNNTPYLFAQQQHASFSNGSFPPVSGTYHVSELIGRQPARGHYPC